MKKKCFYKFKCTQVYTGTRIFSILIILRHSFFDLEFSLSRTSSCSLCGFVLTRVSCTYYAIVCEISTNAFYAGSRTDYTYNLQYCRTAVRHDSGVWLMIPRDCLSHYSCRLRSPDLVRIAIVSHFSLVFDSVADAFTQYTSTRVISVYFATLDKSTRLLNSCGKFKKKTKKKNNNR